MFSYPFISEQYFAKHGREKVRGGKYVGVEFD